MSSKRHGIGFLTAAGALAAASLILLAPAPAAAQETSPVNPTGKGIAGGAMLGGELVMIVEAIIGVDSWWPYVVFGAVGAGGGAVGGYFVEQAGSSSDPPVAEPALYMLAGGMALIVPTLVAVLNATAYDPTSETGGQEDKPDDAEPEGEQPTPGVDVNVKATTGARSRLPLALLGVDLGTASPRVSAGLPAVEVRPRFSRAEIATYGLEQQTEVRIPIVRGRF